MPCFKSQEIAFALLNVDSQMLQGSQHQCKMQAVLPYAPCSRACHGRLTDLRGLHNWSLFFQGGADPGIAAGIDPLRPKLIHCSGLWQVIIMRSLIISPSLFLPKESIKLPPKHNGEI